MRYCRGKQEIMKTPRHSENTLRFVRLLAAMLVLLLVFCAAGCKKEEPVDSGSAVAAEAGKAEGKEKKGAAEEAVVEAEPEPTPEPTPEPAVYVEEVLELPNYDTVKVYKVDLSQFPAEALSTWANEPKKMQVSKRASCYPIVLKGDPFGIVGVRYQVELKIESGNPASVDLRPYVQWLSDGEWHVADNEPIYPILDRRVQKQELYFNYPVDIVGLSVEFSRAKEHACEYRWEYQLNEYLFATPEDAQAFVDSLVY